MEFGPNVDLEAPYQDLCRREEQYQEAEDAAYDELWFDLADEAKAAAFIYDWLADPDKLLRDIVKIVAGTHNKLERLHGSFTEQGARDIAQQCTAARISAYTSIFALINEHVPSAAEIKAGRQI